MVFMKACRKSMFEDYKEEGGYIDYKQIKVVLHQIKEETVPTTPEVVYNALLGEIKRIYEWCQGKIAEYTQVCDRVVQRVKAAHRNPTDSISDLKLTADCILFEVLRFHECRNLNLDIIERIIERHQRYTILKPSQRWLEIRKQYDFHALPLDEIMYLLSVVYAAVRDDEDGAKAGQIPSGAMGSQVFDRRSVKYWVHPQDVPFVIGRIIQHLPLSSYKDHYTESKEKGYPFTLGSQISSVYLDNTNFLFYHRRLERLEGSSLIRMRWYTDNSEPDINSLPPDQDCFIEMKVHHEAWSGERSTKRRFAVKNKHVDDFLKGNFPLDGSVAKLRKKGTPEKEIEKFKALAREVLTKVHSYNLHPVLRSQCIRSAFQRGSDASVRVSIDQDLRLTAEDFGASKHWRYEGFDEMPVDHVPYAVVEVKLQCAENERIAPWIEELMQCRFMESVPKFSKYGHGVATLYGQTKRVQRMPYWVHQVHAEIRAATKPEIHDWDATRGLSIGCVERTEDLVIYGKGQEAQTRTVGASEVDFLGRPGLRAAYLTLVGKKRGLNEFTIEFNLHRRHQSYMEMNVFVDKGFEYQAICGPIFHSDLPVLEGGIPWQTAKRVRVPQKYDPKTLLTAERYFMKYIIHAVHLGLSGLAVINFGGTNHFPIPKVPRGWWRDNLHVLIGLFLMICCLSLALYSTLVLHARSRRIYGKKKLRYDDTFGPTMLSYILVAGIVIVAADRLWLRFGPMFTRDPDF